MGMLEARTGEPEVVQPVIEPDPGDVYAQIGHVGKIRQPHPTRLVHLAEDHVAIRALQRPPASNPTLHRPPHRSEEHTSELQSLMRISYAVFCLKKHNQRTRHTTHRI